MSNESTFSNRGGVLVEDREFSLSELGQTLRRQWKPSILVAAAAFTWMVFSTMRETPLYRSQTLILLSNEQATPAIFGLDETGVAVKDVKDLSTEIQILRSQALVESAIARSETTAQNWDAAQVIENLSIGQAGDADVLIVSYTDADPQRAKDLLDILGQAYVDYSLERQLSQATNAISFIREQLPPAQTELDASAQAIREFRQRYGIVDPDAYAISASDYKQSLEQQARDAEVSLSQVRREYEELRRQLSDAGQNPETALPYTILSQDKDYQDLAERLREIEAQYALERTRLHDTHPTVEDLEFQRQELQERLQGRVGKVLGRKPSPTDLEKASRVEDIQRGLADRLLSVEAQLAAEESRLQALRQVEADFALNFQQIPQLQQTYAELQRQFEVKSAAVDRFLSQLQELEIAEAQEIAPWQILEPAYLPTTPISPNVKRGFVLGAIVGGLLGVGTAIALERLDDRVKYVEQVKRLTQLPLLGSIPKVKSKSGQFASGVREGARDGLFTEALRSLAMNLRYLVRETGAMKVLALTSATPSEGKTTLTYGLAMTIAQLGMRVLAVDGDLRRPTLHQLAGQANATGLSTAIVTERPWLDLVRPGEVENLDILTAGPTPPNPLALLNSAKMMELIEQWRRVYDYVLLDTPPVGLLADMQSLGDRIDSAIFVVGMEKVTQGAIGRAMEMLGGCRVSGFVANFVDRGHGDQTYGLDYADYFESSLNGDRTSNLNRQQIEKLMGIFRRQ
ncbi:MAG: polysaccharide biosynthesis tyrosine autokinase [Cyanobacteriota bacterium]|nr:polysaccharide biosynthesis tyrosine autokinase [Cyanobacteriota bacterium]